MKNWYESRTVWFNIITLLVGLVGEITKAFPMSEGTLKIFGLVLTIGNFVLRLLTGTAIRPLTPDK